MKEHSPLAAMECRKDHPYAWAHMVVYELVQIVSCLKKGSDMSSVIGILPVS